MRLSMAFIASLFLGDVAFAQAFSVNQGCELPKGPYRNSCVNISVTYCANQAPTGMACKFTADCDPDGYPASNYSSHNEFLIPANISFLRARNNDGLVSNSYLDLLVKPNQKNRTVDCSPCILPGGNYKHSCTDIAIVYTPGINGTEAACLFSANCDVLMADNTKPHPRRVAQAFHNTALIPLYTNISDARNYEGIVKDVAANFTADSDSCSEKNVAAHLGPDKIFAALTVGASLLLTV